MIFESTKANNSRLATRWIQKLIWLAGSALMVVSFPDFRSNITEVTDNVRILLNITMSSLLDCNGWTTLVGPFVSCAWVQPYIEQ